MKLGLLLLFSIPVVENENILDTQLIEPLDEIDMELERLPRLEHLVPTLSQRTSADMEHIPDAIVRNVSIDINKINIENFKKKMNTIIDKLAIDEEPKNDTRRQAVIPGTHGHTPYVDGQNQILRRKTLDCMLQTLYMSRHKIREMEGNKYFNTKATGFRIAFTYRRLGRGFTKLMQIYTLSHARRDYWYNPDQQLVLHAKAARLHVDFQYFWWVMIKVDNRYKIKLAEAQKKKKTYFKSPEEDPNYM